MPGGEDGSQITAGEPAGRRGLPQRPICRGRAMRDGQLDGLGHFGLHPGRAGGGCLGQHSPAHPPIARNCASAAVRGLGVRFSAPGGAGG